MISRNNYGLNLFDEFFKDPFFSSAYTEGHDKPMRTDIYEKDGMYLLLKSSFPDLQEKIFRPNWTKVT